MIVLSIDDLDGTERDVRTETWRSRRMVLARERVGFSLHETVMYAGTETSMWYANHVEAVWLVEGTGKLQDLDNDVEYDLAPGTMYLLNGHERHRVLPETRMRMLCVFNPPVTGREVHDENGVYPLIVEPA